MLLRGREELLDSDWLKVMLEDNSVRVALTILSGAGGSGRQAGPRGVGRAGRLGLQAPWSTFRAAVAKKPERFFCSG
ncbi:hypothetical protein AWM79_16355 [Pseudomonas agarici]|uniref:Uncharacterized protein n=1 Tax=Pseudomonas agarici TaxID=46677 RepID=A0A0X1T3Y1_PSEAA|nr:hypothetical protein AWM79_16355 [Pseudomonas agarici]